MLSLNLLKSNELQEEFDIGEFSKDKNVIGEGAFGIVYKG